jgi:hypothetical protein
VEEGLIDLAPCKLTSMWRNKRVRPDRVLKCMDRFLISKNLVGDPIRIKQWVGEGGNSDHLLVFLELVGASSKPLGPFKFNSSWLSKEDFIQLVKETWVPFDVSSKVSASLQFDANLKQIKKVNIG